MSQAEVVLLEVLFLMVAVGIGLFLIRARARLSVVDDLLVPDDLITPLQRQLWRQGRIPTYRSGFRATSLAPVLAYELYSDEFRTLYDRSRTLDLGLLQLLRRTSDDTALVRHVLSLQAMTRKVRRQLIVVAISRDSGSPLGHGVTAETLGHELDVASATLARLSADVDA